MLFSITSVHDVPLHCSSLLPLHLHNPNCTRSFPLSPLALARPRVLAGLKSLRPFLALGKEGMIVGPEQAHWFAYLVPVRGGRLNPA